MPSLILQNTARFLLPLLILFSAFHLLRGHNAPGGGFSGGLVAAAAFVLYALAFGPHAAREALVIDPRRLIGVGLLVALASGIAAIFVGRPWFTALWVEVPVGESEGLHLGTPIIFDIGVYLTVVGATLTIILTLAEEE